jgi:hypothetical protein
MLTQRGKRSKTPGSVGRERKISLKFSEARKRNGGLVRSYRVPVRFQYPVIRGFGFTPNPLPCACR